LFFVPAKLNRVILVPVLVRGNLLLFAALLAAIADDGGPDDGVLLLHKALFGGSRCDAGRGGGLSDEVMIRSPRSDSLLNPRSLVRSPDEPSRLIGLNCPGVKLPLTPRLAKFVELPIRSRLAAPPSKTSVLLRSKYELLASLRCLGVAFSIGILCWLSSAGDDIEGLEAGIIFAVLELARLKPCLCLVAAPSKLLLEPISQALSSSDAISLTKIAGSLSFNLSIASCNP
jgi:hypothetical protein